MEPPLVLLNRMLADMADAPAEFAPTNFWQSGLPLIVDDLTEHGFASFRSHRSARSFYVPEYADRRYGEHRNRFETAARMLPQRVTRAIRWRIDGSALARNDYRLFCATDTDGGLPLRDVSESTVVAGERHHIDGRVLSRPMLNYLRALTLLKRSADTADLASVLEIGGGFGTLGEILLRARPDDGFYVDVDIPPVAAVATYYLQRVFGHDAVLSYDQSRDLDALDLNDLRGRYRAVVLCPWQLPQVTGACDLFANFASFQEMEPAVVANYISIVQPRASAYVLTRNSTGGKQVVDPGRTGVINPVSTDDVIDGFTEFDVIGRDSLVHGDESPDRSFRSEVVALARR